MPRKILFVCTGNICRSPTAEGVARGLAQRLGLADRFEFDSAGTHGYHVGEAPDPRSVAAAGRRGYELAALRARRVTAFDFVRFDHYRSARFARLSPLAPGEVFHVKRRSSGPRSWHSVGSMKKRRHAFA